MNRNFLLFVFGLLVIPAIYGQKDTAKIDALNLKSEFLYSVDVEKSIALSSKALRLSQEADYRPGEAFALMNLAIANDIKGNPEIAIRYFHQAIHLFKLEKDDENLSYCYSQLGVCYFTQFQYDNSNWYYNKAIALCKKLKLDIDLADVLVNQGITFTYQKKEKEAVANFRRAIDIYLRNDYEQGLGPAYNSLAKIYHEKQEFDTAIDYYLKAAEIAKKYDNDLNLTSTYNGLSNAYINLKQYGKAHEYALKSLEAVKNTGAKEREAFAYYTVSDSYAASGDFRKAYEYQKRYADLKDTVFTSEKSSALAEMQARFEVESNKQKLKEAKLKQQIQSETYARQLTILAVALVLILIVLIFLFLLFRNKRRIHQLLEQKYEMSQMNLEQKESMMGEIHHRVKNNLQMVHAILDLQARDLKDPESMQLIEDSLNRINAISLIHQKLYQTENIRAVRMTEYLCELTDDLVIHFRKEVSKPIRVMYEVEDLNLDIESALPIGLIVAELVTNSCKYAFADQQTPEIRLVLKEDAGKLRLLVGDNGSGKTNEENGTHFGTKLIRTMSKKLQAAFTETNSEKGLTVELLISNYHVYHD